jgi:hypothetical protein
MFSTLQAGCLCCCTTISAAIAHCGTIMRSAFFHACHACQHMHLTVVSLLLTATATAHCECNNFQNQVMGVAVNYNSTRAATVSLDGTWRVWDITVRYNLDENPRCAAIYQIDTSKGESPFGTCITVICIRTALCELTLKLLRAVEMRCAVSSSCTICYVYVLYAVPAESSSLLLRIECQ